MNDKPIRRIVIVGGGTAGWMAAAPLAQRLARRPDAPCEVILVESPDIGTIGVGEATLPTIRYYNAALGLDADDFVRRTKASYKLGIEFKDWGHLGNRFFHGFGDFGPSLDRHPSHLFWLRMSTQFDNMPALENWSVSSIMARKNKFVPPHTGTPSITDAYSYGYHFDAGLYANYLRDYAVAHGAQRLEGTVVEVEQHPESGFITAVKLRDGRRIEGDLFVDCSGFRGLLIEGALKAGYDDWSEQLPCNSALAVPCASAPALTPYTRSTAKEAGWVWRIPLQHRTGNGHVYCSRFISDDEAAATLLSNLDGRALAEPRLIRFQTGMRKLAWNRNVVALGLSSGFLEPLESTSIHLIQSGIQRLLDFFPDRGWSAIDRDEYNRQSRFDYERIRDFIILHYHLNQRTDSEYWKECANMTIPDTLRHKMAMYRSHGRVVRVDNELFSEVGWIQVFEGQNMPIDGYHPLADAQSEEDIAEYLESVRDVIAKCVDVMPSHNDYIARMCAAKKM